MDLVAADGGVAGESRLARAEGGVVDGGADGVLTADPVQVANVLTLVVDATLAGRTVGALHAFQGLALYPRIAGRSGRARAKCSVIDHGAEGPRSASALTRIDASTVPARRSNWAIGV